MKTLDIDKVLKFFPLEKPREVQKHCVAEAVKGWNRGAKFVVMDAPTGCHGAGTPIMLATGETIPVEDVAIGDELMGLEGPVKVSELKRGTQEMFEVIPVKGDPFTVNLDHILTLVHTEHGEVVDVSVREWLTWSTYRAHCYKLFRVAVPHWKQPQGPRSLPIAPYVLGLLIGDGALTKGCIVCKPDEELTRDLREEALSWGLRYRFTGEEHRLTVQRGSGENALWSVLCTLKLNVTSEERFVPEVYKTGSIAIRREVLAGLLDTDGHLANNCFDFISKSRQLSEDVTFIARSLGLAAYLKPCEKYDQNGQGGTYFRVSISGDTHTIPTRIPRKQARKREQKKDVTRTGFVIEPLGVGNFFGFSLEGDPHYLLGDFTVTHNTGKSAIAVTLARALEQSYMLTLTEQLQEQYLKDFKQHGLEALKGRGKFVCANGGGSLTCATGKVQFGTKCKACPYKAAKERALKAPHTVANYHSFLFNVGGPQAGFGADEDMEDPHRPLLVVDECHALEGFLLDQVGVTVKLNKLPFVTSRPPDDLENPEPYWTFMEEELEPKLVEAIAKTPDAVQKEELRFVLMRIISSLGRRDELEWIPERERLSSGNGINPDTFTLKPLLVSPWGKWITDYGERLLLMSGTVLDAHTLVSSLGLNPDDGDHVEVPSPFPKEHRPIYVGNLDMSFKGRAESWPLMVQVIDQLLEAHPKEKGLILPQSMEMAKYLKKKLKIDNASRLVIASGDERMDQYWEHCRSGRPSVLCAPGFWEGADLKGDLSRFQIIPSLPRAPWQGQIKARAERGGDRWYRWLTATKLLQGIGRSVRSESDTAVTYVLDRDFRRELDRKKDSLIPQWVRDAVTLVD